MRNPKFKKLLDQLLDIHERKNADYATSADPLSNFRECEAFGIPAWKGCLVRMSDKWSRLKQLASLREPAVKEESILDTLMDLSCYSLICILLLREVFDEEKEATLKELLNIGKNR